MRWKLWLGWASGALLATAIPGHLYLHYYQYEVPVACVAGGWAAAGLLARPVARWVAVGLGLGLSIAHELPSYRLTPDEWSAAKGVGDFAEQQRLGQRLGRLLRPGERFWEDGQDNTLYFAAGTSPVSGLLYPDPLRTGPGARANQARLWAELTAARPDVIVTRTVRLSGADMPLPHLADWMKQQYVPVDSVTTDCPGFRVHVRRDSRLLRTLALRAATAP